MSLQVLFVHGMGRSPLSAWPMLRHLRQAGLKVSTFAYMVSLEPFEAIAQRLNQRMVDLAGQGDYIVVGHSLGGVLLRSAMASLPDGARRPRHLFLLGSPVHSARLARVLKHNPVFRVATGDCGQLLASHERMAAVPAAPCPVTSVVGNKGPRLGLEPFSEPNDGVVSCSETRADWITEEIELPTVHTTLPADRRVADIILQRVRNAGKPIDP